MKTLLLFIILVGSLYSSYLDNFAVAYRYNYLNIFGSSDNVFVEPINQHDFVTKFDFINNYYANLTLGLIRQQNLSTKDLINYALDAGKENGMHLLYTYKTYFYSLHDTGYDVLPTDTYFDTPYLYEFHNVSLILGSLAVTSGRLLEKRTDPTENGFNFGVFYETDNNPSNIYLGLRSSSLFANKDLADKSQYPVLIEQYTSIKTRRHFWGAFAYEDFSSKSPTDKFTFGLHIQLGINTYDNDLSEIPSVLPIMTANSGGEGEYLYNNNNDIQLVNGSNLEWSLIFSGGYRKIWSLGSNVLEWDISLYTNQRMQVFLGSPTYDAGGEGYLSEGIYGFFNVSTSLEFHFN